MPLLFRKFGHTPESLEIAKRDMTISPNTKHMAMQLLLDAYKQPLPKLAEIKKFEQQTEISLPQDYIDFLLTTNGGYPERYYIPTIEKSIDHFYPFNCPYPSSSMNELLLFNKKDYSKNGYFFLLPIACSLSGDEYLMKLDQTEQYCIYFYNYTDLDLIDFDESKLVFVADSFSVFLNLLVDYKKVAKL